ncbi:hypothetical protein Zmor_009267 [Zophobas morio]|uniref:Calponin-homology (CH) domain-containing protein n=1 Tax=Zophobas morio TaxID=2755281 RepID=A0AA38ILH0_9CUCU|nr:hypothetical protein Zmor_009267 [Zophobas morio]
MIFLQIYTDWANHYLEKARSKKRVNSLAADCSDGVLLAEVIESVTCQKIPDINRKPKTPSQMVSFIILFIFMYSSNVSYYCSVKHSIHSVKRWSVDGICVDAPTRLTWVSNLSLDLDLYAFIWKWDYTGWEYIGVIRRS